MNRYYSSTLGRFLSPDPYRANNGGPGNPKDPESWNRYAYVESDLINFNDPGGLTNCGTSYGTTTAPDGTVTFTVTAYECTGATGGGNGQGGFGCWDCELRIFNPPSPPDAGGFNAYGRAIASDAIEDMGPGCEKALGSKWDLSSVLNKADSDIYLDGTNPGVANQTMTSVGYPQFGDETVGQFLQGGSGAPGVPSFTEQYNGVPDQYIVLGAFFDGPGAAGSPLLQTQNAPLVHEVLHTYTGLGDVGLASKLGLGDFTNNPNGASTAISNYIAKDCP
jgi:hypothetical protein